MNRVVVTGLGVLSPIANGAEAFHRAQIAGKSGIRTITQFDASSYPTQFAGEVDVDISTWLSRKEAKRLDRFSQFAVIAADMALEDSGVNLDQEDKTRIGTLFGSGIGGMDTWETQSKIALNKNPLRMSPFFIPMMITNMASAQVALRYGLMGASSTVVTACSTGSDAIGGAFRMLQYGEADVMLAGATEASITPMAIGGFSVMKALSTRNDAPEQASRPFSHSRDGFVLGEGAGVMVLETLEHAKARGAHIYAEVKGYGRAADAYHMVETHPDGAGAALAMQAALKDAQLAPTQIDYLNAHATSTPVGDRSEVLAFKKVFGDASYKLPISSLKSMIGHLLGAAGAVEAIATVQALVSGVLPPTINLIDVDPELDLDFIPNQAREVRVDYALSNSFAFGGQNASLIFGRV
ncbi:MAG: beta-ketoacyl-ACP synthase II [Deinococcota bacterium]